MNGGSPVKYRGIFAAQVLAHALADMAAVIVDAPPSVAQQPAPKAQPKVQPKAAPAPTPQPQQGGQPQLTYSSWTKVCQKGPETNAKRICFIGKDGRVESGMPVVAAVLIEPEGETKKLLRAVKVCTCKASMDRVKLSASRCRWPILPRPMMDRPPIPN
jgi:invasion protein IalB